MIVVKSRDEVERIADACRIVAEALEVVKQAVAPGVSTRELERMAEEVIMARGGRPAFKGYRGYPASICTSVNEQVVHGIPSDRRLEKGDIVSIDLGVVLRGYYGDAALTVPVGRVDPQTTRLVDATREALERGIEQVREGNRISDISHAVQRYAESCGFSVVRDFVGHGIGTQLHEEPQVPNFGRPGTGIRLREGMTLAIEPMVNAGGHEVRVLADGWTAVSADGSLSAHFEHTVAVTAEGARVLTRA